MSLNAASWATWVTASGPLTLQLPQGKAIQSLYFPSVPNPISVYAGANGTVLQYIVASNYPQVVPLPTNSTTVVLQTLAGSTVYVYYSSFPFNPTVPNPLTTVPASSVTPGTFPAGLFTFPSQVIAASFAAGSSTYGATSATVAGPLSATTGTFSSGVSVVGGIASIATDGTNAYYKSSANLYLDAFNGTSSNYLQLDTSNNATLGNSGSYLTGSSVYGATGCSIAGNLVITGSATKPGGGSWAAPSDLRIKKNVETYTTGLSAILALHPVSFQYNGKGGTVDDGKSYVGFIAQEVELVDKSMVRIDPSKDFPDQLSLDTSNIVPMLVRAIQELQAEIEKLKNR